MRYSAPSKSWSSGSQFFTLLSREDNARRRASEETPEARRERVAKAQTTRNKSIRRDKIRLHWGMQPLGKLVKRW